MEACPDTLAGHRDAALFSVGYDTLCRSSELAAMRITPQQVMGLSGHSMRVDAAQDMMLSGFDTLGIMQAGGWRTYSVLSCYVENASAARMHLRRWGSISSR